MIFSPPAHDCSLCPRLTSFRTENAHKFPDKHNAPVPSFGDMSASLLIVGLAPGLKGANFSGRPFTGDYAGDLLYGTLLKFGRAQGQYEARADDGLTLIDTRITNAVRCVPPQNKPETSEIKHCLDFLKTEIAAMPSLKAILTLGLVSHNAVIKVLGGKAASYKFAHGAVHDLGGIRVFNSYHCSRYNTQTKRLTTEMFEAVFTNIACFTQP
ncbi:MAG: uracil-DNA glycosylase [Alphaproteobacteria bacterium]|nr:uracil-DNA glycosylase [Alphaproteobacteria bacterium]